jgi:hypothetical protein
VKKIKRPANKSQAKLTRKFKIFSSLKTASKNKSAQLR